jgi:hypothetical protein
MNAEETWKFQVGNKRYPVVTWMEGRRRFFKFGYNKALLNEIKMMKGAKYHGFDEKKPRKLWSVETDQRNDFQINFLRRGTEGIKDPYERYDAPLPAIEFEPRYHHGKKKHIPHFKHQPPMTMHMFMRRWVIVAGEMGVAKSLSFIEAAEMAYATILNETGRTPTIWYVGPRSAIAAVTREIYVWGCKVPMDMMTYEGMVKRMKEWRDGDVSPAIVIFDESSKIKTPTSIRSQMAKALADGCRKDWGDHSYIWLLTGSPAPKNPVDWYWQAEIACPGFLKEGDIHKFKKRLCIIEMKQNFDGGGMYPSIVTWKDDERKCNICGKFKDDPDHDMSEEGVLMGGTAQHPWEKSVNEVAFLYERLKGLVVVYFKKDCLDLPAKHYRVIELKPSNSVLRAASALVKVSPTVIEGLTRLRELSDGFQYEDVPDGMRICLLCGGSKEAVAFEAIPGTCPNCEIEETRVTDNSDLCPNHIPKANKVVRPCGRCGGTGEEKKFRREVKEVRCPKDDALKDILDEHEDIGRIVVFAGFTGSIDRCVKVCLRNEWAVIRMDQGGVKITNKDGPISEKDFLKLFQDMKDEYPRVAFIAHPKSGGMGLTLTASPTIVYYSNTFDAEDRIQSEDRIHRPGMDTNLGATIIDLVHLPSDHKVLENLKRKRDLQAITLGDFSALLQEGSAPRANDDLIGVTVDE